MGSEEILSADDQPLAHERLEDVEDEIAVLYMHIRWLWGLVLFLIGLFSVYFVGAWLATHG